MLMGCLREGPRREARPAGWEVEEVGLEPVFRWSFSAFRSSTVD